MIRIKAKTKNCQIILHIKLASSDRIDEKEFALFSRSFIRGFFKPKLIKENLIEYLGPISVPLSQRLKSPISKYDFYFLIEQIVVATQKLQNSKLPWNKVLWNLQSVYINKTTKEIQFVYLPLQEMKEDTNILGFIETIIYSSVPATDEKDENYMSRFMYFLKSLSYYDPEKIENYILREDRSVVNIIKKHNIGGSGFMTDKPQDYFEHYEKKNDGLDNENTRLIDDEETSLLYEKDDEATGLLNGEDEATSLLYQQDEATGLLNEDDEATGLLSENRNVHYATLHRILTDEDIPINKPVFRIGKEKSYVDYFVTNNNAVSRGHADIVIRGKNYFVIDLNSKNKTYINDTVLPVRIESEIFDGDRLMLGNEEFIFRI